MALEVLKGVEEIMKNDGGGGGKWTQFISWKGGDVKDIAFLTPAEDILKLRLHNFVKIPTVYKNDKGEEEQGFRWATFVCRKDPAFRDESGNTCKLCDEIGHVATEKFVALAVELDAQRDGKKVLSLNVARRNFTDKDGNERSVPNWGLVIQSKKNFMQPLVAREQLSGELITDVGWTIARNGNDNQTTYAFVDLRAPLPDMTAIRDEVPNLLDLVEEMGSEEKYERDLVDVLPGSQPSYGSDKKEPAPSSMSSAFNELKAELESRPKTKVEEDKAVESY